jgi:uncharacterized protein YdaU (DUF1376 family)
MKFFTKVAGLAAVARLNEEALYAQVHTEIEGGDIRQGLWLKALSDSDGNELKAKAKYAKARVKSLKDEAAIAKVVLEEQEQKSRERKIHEEIRREQQKEKKAEAEKTKQENTSKQNQKNTAAEFKEKLGGQKGELDINAATQFLLQNNYEMEAWANGWEVRAPFSGFKERFANDDLLIKYVQKRLRRLSAEPSNDARAFDINKAKEFLSQHNYKIKSWANGWEVREPLGGRVRLRSDDDLIDYAESRCSLP